MRGRYEVVVVGLGAMGCAATWQLARRGVRVLGLERWQVGHDRGSSHGQTRLTRQAYFEHPDYVPLLLRAHALWDELGERRGQTLLHRTGLVLIGPPAGSELIDGTLLAARLHGIAVQTLDAAQVRSGFPGLIPSDGQIGVHEPGAGWLKVGVCVRQMAAEARKAGAVLSEGERLLSWKPEAGGVMLQTDRGTWRADRLVLTTGAWSGPLLAELGHPLSVHRNVLVWFEATDEAPVRGGPCFGFDEPDGLIYGFPSMPPWGVKVAHHLPGELLRDPDHVDRSLRDADLAPLQRFVRKRLRGLSDQPVHHAVCLYEMSPDGHFVVDRHPANPQVVVAGGFSGHGFKFAPVIGEALADLATTGRTELPIGFLGLGDRPRPPT